MIKARMAITLIAALTLAVVPLAAAAGGRGELRYRDVVTDARQANMPDQVLARWADILKGSRAVVRHDGGGQWIRAKVWARRGFPIPKRAIAQMRGYSALGLNVYLDIRKGDEADISLHYGATYWHSKVYQFCTVDDPRYGHVKRCQVDTTRDGALVLRTRTPLPIDKHGRWQIVSDLDFTRFRPKPRTFDSAPDCVWSCS